MYIRVFKATALAVLMGFSSACMEAPTYIDGKDLHDQRLSLFSTKMGVHPNTDVLDDPNNPFLDS